MFKYTKDVAMPWIPYFSFAVILLSAFGAVGLIKYGQWGFYGICLSYPAGVLVVGSPFFPGFIPAFASGIYGSIITLVMISAVLSILIYLYLVGKKRLYFRKTAQI
jgi:hypothetical protein